jgi:hypothetical protein
MKGLKITEYAWSGRDNQFKLSLTLVDGSVTVPADLTDVTAALLELKNADGSDPHSLTVNRDEVGAIINWWDGALVQTGEIVFTLGLWAGEVFTFDETYTCRLTLTTGNSPNGIVWISWGDSHLSQLDVKFFESV